MPHAVIVVSSHPKETFEEQNEFLRERIVPMVKSQPGFAIGHWARELNGPNGYSYVRFATEADARRMEAFMKEEAARPNPMGVKITSVIVVEELASATA
jgi:hypothetical protein